MLKFRAFKKFLSNRSRIIPRFLMRSFEAAKIDRLLAPWTWDGGFSNREIQAALATSRSRSRDMFKNNAHYRRYIYLCQTNIVGEGFSFKSIPHDGVAGQSNFRLDRNAAMFIQYHWLRWCKNKNWVDATKRKTMVEIDKLNVKTWKRDGEYIVLLNRNAQNPYGLTLRIVRPDALDHEYNTILPNGNFVRMGVELDRNSLAPVAYYFLTTKEYEDVRFHGHHLSRFAAKDVIHGYTQEDEDQTRGITGGHAILAKLKMLAEYDKSELIIARDEANTSRTYYAAANQSEDIADLTDPDNDAVAGRLIAQSEPGQKEILPFGWKSEVQAPKHPNREVTNFKNSMLRDIASGTNVEYANFANDWRGVSFSSVRQGTISERDSWKSDQHQYIEQFKTPVFLAWLESFLSLAISGAYPAEKFDKFSEHTFKGRRWDWVDPVRDVNAAVKATEKGWKTDSEVAAEYGNDFDANIEEIKRLDEIKKGTSLEVKDVEETQKTTQ